MVVYCHTATPRLHYVIDFLSRYYGLPIQLTTDRQVYLAAGDARINYTNGAVDPGEIIMHPHALLFEKGITDRVPDVFVYEKTKAFFRTGGSFPFDLFAAVFYLLSRYEEYLPYEPDVYGRYGHENSRAYREHFLKIPLIDHWLQLFRKMLSNSFPALSFGARNFQWVPTYDIDIAWSYLGKGWFRNAGGLARDISKKNLKAAHARISTLLRRRSDPFDAYPWLHQVHSRYHRKALFFFLVAAKAGRYDKNIHPGNEALQELIRETAKEHTVGLHPSWQSGDNCGLLEKEKQALGRIAGQNVLHSRQHFLRFTLPGTYRRLLAAGITHDYSMGYGTINGFRASVACPFFWYDLEREETTKLLVHPFCFMDANAYYELGLNAEAAAAELDAFMQEVRSVQGTLYTIWHNNFLGTDPAFEGWRAVYECFVRSAVI